MINWGKVFLISAAAGAAVLITTVVVMGFQISHMKRQMNDTYAVYHDELERNRVSLDRFSQNLQIVSSGSNEVRRYMNLPDKQLLNQEEEVSAESQDPAVSFFDAFRYLVSEDERDNRAALFSRWIEDNNLKDFFESRNFSFTRKSYDSISVERKGISLLSMRLSDNSEEISVKDIAGNESGIPINAENASAEFFPSLSAISIYEKQVIAATDTVKAISEKQETVDILDERGMELEKEGDGLYHIINKKDMSPVGSFGTEGPDFLLNGKIYPVENEFTSELNSFLNTVNLETESERIDSLVLAKMQEVFSDEGFKVLLDSEGCLPDLRREEDNEFIYFHIYNIDGSLKGSFVLQKDFGEVLLISGDGKYLKSLNMFTTGNDFKSLILDDTGKENPSPYAFDESSETFLVVGTHEHNADTMIIVNANNKTGKIKTISFPRDLYYKGNKINNIYKEFGPEQLCVELSKITGLNIKKYVSIDMFAFVDVINILGGIDVTLESDLIDPTYKVKNNGVWTTLYYRKGTHHLDGVEALRIARSRHGSEAYDRSNRQQLIVKAIMNKMASLDGGDISTVYDFVTSVFSYIDTNLSIADLVKNFAMYKDNDIEDPVTLNLDNILDAKWTNTYMLPTDEEEKLLEDENFFKGQWIVVPRNNDWNLFIRFIGNILNNGI